MNPIVNCSAHGVPLEGVIHVGANHGREYEAYARTMDGPILMLEAIPSFVEEIDARMDKNKPHFIRKAIVGEEAGKPIAFNVASNDGRSSSMLELGTLSAIRPNITYTERIEGFVERLDDIVLNEHAGRNFSLLCIDVQGADLLVLKGAERILDQIDAIYVEVAAEPAYVGGAEFVEIVNFLYERDYVFRECEMIREGWGNAFFSRRRGRLHRYAEQSLAKGCAATQSSTIRSFTADRAVNGDILSAITSTQLSDAPWWQVDLGSVKDVSRVIFVDRPNAEEHTKSLVIEASVDGEKWRRLYNRNGRMHHYMVDRVWEGQARYFRVSLAERGILTFKQFIVL